jgi:hypothetical protein
VAAAERAEGLPTEPTVEPPAVKQRAPKPALEPEPVAEAPVVAEAEPEAEPTPEPVAEEPRVEPKPKKRLLGRRKKDDS